MFESKRRDVVIPQAEHSRLTGALAYHWGNDDFDKPPHFDGFVVGATLHDRGYGEHDDDPIGRVPRERWLAIQKRGVERSCPDPVADIVAVRHIKRLLSYDDTPERRALAATAEARIESRLRETDITRDAVEWMDRVMDLLDGITFDFGFEAPTRSMRSIRPRYRSGETVSVHYALESGGIVTVDPWPFGVDRIEGYILGYEASEYPKRLAPIMVTYVVRG